MEMFLNTLGQIFRGIFRIFEAIFSGIVSIIREYPRFFALLVGAAVFMYCLQNVQGFGDAVAFIIALLIIIWLAKAMMMPSGKKKKR